MTRSPRDRPSAAEKKERQVRTGQVDRGMAVPATSADLVNLPQDFSLNSLWQRPARQCTKDFNVRASLFVGPRLSVVFPEGVQGVPWRRRARLLWCFFRFRRWTCFPHFGHGTCSCWFAPFPVIPLLSAGWQFVRLARMN